MNPFDYQHLLDAVDDAIRAHARRLHRETGAPWTEFEVFRLPLEPLPPARSPGFGGPRFASFHRRLLVCCGRPVVEAHVQVWVDDHGEPLRLIHTGVILRDWPVPGESEIRTQDWRVWPAKLTGRTGAP